MEASAFSHAQIRASSVLRLAGGDIAQRSIAIADTLSQGRPRRLTLMGPARIIAGPAGKAYAALHDSSARGV